MGTSLTPDFWRLFAVLLVISAVATFVVSAVLDTLVVRLRQRRLERRESIGGRDGTSERSGNRRSSLVRR
ncbi:hypothetical protein F9278_19835 [Streptomyces phaeolivaceus]|uniref:Uncharacterized protein n=1 Tax=Streptomyces phaeolivaceus TaxID=2653200 RepID=A0A5P8K509_9ACTN|nr:hypothetical protein [Streptomyces phaeolivaceus]QFQ98090.1 hypothetical protein F9278_19835 [Streptomyces phaeolivaceus]